MRRRYLQHVLSLLILQKEFQPVDSFLVAKWTINPDFHLVEMTRCVAVSSQIEDDDEPSISEIMAELQSNFDQLQSNDAASDDNDHFDHDTEDLNFKDLEQEMEELGHLSAELDQLVQQSSLGDNDDLELGGMRHAQQSMSRLQQLRQELSSMLQVMDELTTNGEEENMFEEDVALCEEEIENMAIVGGIQKDKGIQENPAVHDNENLQEGSRRMEDLGTREKEDGEMTTISLKGDSFVPELERTPRLETKSTRSFVWRGEMRGPQWWEILDPMDSQTILAAAISHGDSTTGSTRGATAIARRFHRGAYSQDDSNNATMAPSTAAPNPTAQTSSSDLPKGSTKSIQQRRPKLGLNGDLDRIPSCRANTKRLVFNQEKWRWETHA